MINSRQLHIITLGIILMTCLSASAQSENDELRKELINKHSYQVISDFDTITYDPQRIYALYIKDDKFGLISILGKEITQPVYDEFPHLFRYGYNRRMPRSQKFMAVRQDKLYGLIDLDGGEVTPCTYSRIDCQTEIVHQPNIGHRKVVLGYKLDSASFTITLDPAGKEVKRIKKPLPPEEDYELGIDEAYERMPSTNSYPVSGSYQQGYDKALGREFNERLIQKRDPKSIVFYGFTNKSRDTLIPMVYNQMYLDAFGNINVVKYHTQYDSFRRRYRIIDKTYGLFNWQGMVLLKPEYEKIERYNHVYLVQQKGRLAIFDSTAKQRSKFIYDEKQSSGNHEFMSLARDGKYALFDAYGKRFTKHIFEKVACPYDEYLPFTMLFVAKDGKEAIMDVSGEYYTDFIYDQIIAECHVDGREGIKITSDFHSSHPNRFFYIKEGDKWGIMDTTFKVNVPCKYSSIHTCHDDNLLFVQQGNMWGIHRLSDNKIIYNFKSEISPVLRSGYIVVRENKKFGIIDKQGNYVIEPSLPSSPYIDLIYPGLLEARCYYYNNREYTYFDDLGNVSGRR